MNAIKHGFYSATAAKQHGTVVYLSPSGNEVEVTAVYDSIEQGEQDYKWEDKRYVGPVDKYVRSVKPHWDDALSEWNNFLKNQ
jgi:hypothetical protein